MRECLRNCLAEAIPDHDVVTFASIDEWERARSGTGTGDLVVLYYDPREAGRGAAQREAALRSRIGPKYQPVLLCDSEDPSEIVERLNEAPRGYIPTNVSLKVAIEAMRLVRAGGVFVPASCLLQRRGAEEAGSADPRSQFTPRQTAVLEQLPEGQGEQDHRLRAQHEGEHRQGPCAQHHAPRSGRPTGPRWRSGPSNPGPT